MIQEEKKNKITIADVADALGVSKTTVSRAISGKGRVGQGTRMKVLNYIESNNYIPNPMAKGLARSKTYNIGWAMPGDSAIPSLPFFQRCMLGVSDVAVSEDYDILLTMVYEDDISQLKRVAKNRKVDGFILGRTLMEDQGAEFLKESGIPFVTIGSSEIDGIVQVDNDHIAACKELTSILIMKGITRFALIGGGLNHVVNHTRLRGFREACEEHDIYVDEDMIYLNNEAGADVERAVDDALRNQADCIICMDDRVCASTLAKLRKENVSIPEDIKIASFYNSELLENNQPAITTLSYDPKELGAVACRTLFEIMEDREVANRQLIGYEVLLKGSTQ
ncbi:MAG: LacI family DNA-binding transcriptional regulator [Eubacterium sp.]|nr:LacI family DNA-binding transcriptional regulator [Eubacterium sp.]